MRVRFPLNKSISKILLFVFLLSAGLQAQYFEYNHPELKWKSFDTPHFTVHFTNGTRRTALLVAKIAEEIYPHVTGIYNYMPKSKIHFVIRDTDDYSNGGAYFLDNKIDIWASNLDYIMRGTTNWLRNVVTHEFTHMISIQKMMKSNLTVPFGFLQLFDYEKERRKDVVRGFPNTLMVYPISSIILPVWFAEGTAQHQVNGSRYDYRDPHREMILRDRVLHHQLLSYGAMSVFGKGSQGNESSYNQGFSFVNYLARRFGESILKKITARASRWDEFTFEGALRDATGFTADSLYTAWKDSLEHAYDSETKVIRRHLVTGRPVEREGSANLYPVWSPDGNKIAYTSNKGEDYFSKNKLIVFDRKSGEKSILRQGISSSLSWSPDGRYLAYAGQERNKHGSSFNDLYVYDFKTQKEIRLTYNLRGTNPDFSRDGKRLCFVSATNGLTQLNVLELSDSLRDDPQNKVWFNREKGTIRFSDPEDEDNWRPVRFSGKRMEQLLAFENGRQIFHPRWSNADSVIFFDTAVEYGRNLGLYNLKQQKFRLFMAAEEELRYPFVPADSPYLYYAASTTGIYNIYRRNLQTGATDLLTNVTGGAMMPAVNRNGELVYANYDSLEYQIYTLKEPRPLNPAFALYRADYIQTIPQKNFDNTLTETPKIRPYKQVFTDIHILPRLWIDYGTVKPGFFLTSADVLNKYNLVAGAAMNKDWDYDLYGYFEMKEFEPTLFVEAYNISANIKNDTLVVPRGNYANTYHRDINFDLTEVHAGLSGRLFDMVDYKAEYVWRRYTAKIDQKQLWDAYRQQWEYPFTFQYTYLKGQALEIGLTADHVHADKDRAINPRGGYFVHLKYGLEYNQFLSNFAISTTGLREIYDIYFYNQLELDAETYFKNPLFPSHGMSVRLRGGYIDRAVDSFFDLYAGGLLGMKGYSYFSLEGRYKAIVSAAYRFPLWQNMDIQFGDWYLDKLYFGVFYDQGNAWSHNNRLKFSDFKRDVGLQLRLDAFSYSLFPTRLFAEAVYPLDTAENLDRSRNILVRYPQNWRYYFGLLYEFDIREKMGKMLPRR